MPPKILQTKQQQRKKKTEEYSEEEDDDTASTMTNPSLVTGDAYHVGERGNAETARAYGMQQQDQAQMIIMMQQQLTFQREEAAHIREQQRIDKIEEKRANMEAAEQTRRATVAASEEAQRRHTEAMTLLREQMEMRADADDRARERRERLTRMSQILPKYTEPCDLGCYLLRLETIMRQENVPRAEWIFHLRQALKGKAADMLTTFVQGDDVGSYTASKDILMGAMGLTKTQYEDQLFNPSKPLETSVEDIGQKSTALIAALRPQDPSDETWSWFIQKTWILRHFNEDCVAWVKKQESEDLAALVMTIREYERRHGNSTRLKYKPQPRPNSNSDRWTPRERQSTNQEFRPYGPPRNRPYNQPSRRSPPRDVGPTRQDSKWQDSRWQDSKCFTCGDMTHRAADCPTKKPLLKNIKKEANVYYVHQDNITAPLPTYKGHCRGKPITILADTGAEITLVRESVVPQTKRGPDTCKIEGIIKGRSQAFPLTTLSVQLGGVIFVREAAVLPDANLSTDVILSIPWEEHPMKAILGMKHLQIEPTKTVGATRAQRVQEQTTAEDTAQQEAVDQIQIKNPDRYAECPDPADSPADETPFPMPTPNKEEAQTFCRDVREDDTLTEWRTKAVDLVDGFYWDKEFLMLKTSDPIRGHKELLVIPQQHRRELFRLAHDHHGHMGAKKIKPMLLQRVTWPRLHTDVQKWCEECTPCQMQRKNKFPRAPMQLIPVMTVPFEQVAMDIVGPFPRTKSGYRFLLTIIDVASRYPEAIPLRSVTAVEVAEGLLDVFSRHGLPRVILSDQGTQLIGKLIQQMCDRLHIAKIQTTAYHPQANGCVERLHGTLVPMLRKTIQADLDWAQQTKLCLFAIRATPNRSTGFSPFELLFGRTLRSPADLLIDQWRSPDQPTINVVEWVEHLTKRLETLRDVSQGNGEMAQATNKLYHDIHTQTRDVQVGSMVLLRNPGLGHKLESSWTGPFEVLRKPNAVNIEIARPGKPTKKRRVVHVNLTKPYHPPEHKVMRILMVAEETEPDEETLTVAGDQLTVRQQKQLDELIQAQEIFSDDPGVTTLCEHHIGTGDSLPIRSQPYAISQTKDQGVRTELRSLVSKGILVPSTSPWASPLVPLIKPDGTVRVCVDYRKLNAVTTPDPYYMPMIEQIIARVGAAKFLTKMDLSKGFYQVRIAEADQQKTAIITPIGKFMFTRMPFGLRNAPATFQRLMDVVLAGQEESAVPYIDDILVYSDTWEDHLQHLKTVFRSIHKAGLTVKMAKCGWARRTLEHLGQMIGNGQVSVPEAKMHALNTYQLPLTKSKMASFLGYVGYYRKFIANFAAKAKSLQETTRVHMPNKIEWTDERRLGFTALRASLGASCVLHIPGPSDHLLLQTDASYDGIGGCLSILRDQTELPVAFYSRKLKPAECNYTVSELECLAVVATVRHFEVYLDGRAFTIQTDHKALEYLQSAHLNNRRLTRWALQLQGHHYNISYRPGRENANADGLSRQSWSPPPSSPGTAQDLSWGDVGPAS